MDDERNELAASGMGTTDRLLGGSGAISWPHMASGGRSQLRFPGDRLDRPHRPVGFSVQANDLTTTGRAKQGERRPAMSLKEHHPVAMAATSVFAAIGAFGGVAVGVVGISTTCVLVFAKDISDAAKWLRRRRK